MIQFLNPETHGILYDKGVVDALPTDAVPGDMYTFNGEQYFARTVNDVLTWVALGGSGGGITAEVDPFYTADKPAINTRLTALETATNISVDEKYNFTTRADADAYFSVHPDELTAGRMVLFDGGIWEWDGTDWKSAVEVVVGPKGEKGDDGYPYAPNYAGTESVNRITASDGTWTVDRDGFVYMYGMCNTDGTHFMYVNDKLASTQGCFSRSRFGVILQVSVGDVVRYTIDQPANLVECGCYYIPPKAVVSNVANAYGMTPDYANRESTSRMSVGNQTWVADKDGFITLGFRAVTTSEVQVLIDNLGIYRETLSVGTTSTITIPVAAGDTVTVTATGDGLSLLACLYIPPKVKPLDGFSETDPKYMADKPIIDAKQAQQDSRLTVLETATNVSVDQKYVFQTEQEADDYFALHPSELTDGLMVMFSGSLWKYTPSGWEAVMELVVGPKGEQGDPGYPYAPDYSATETTNRIVVGDGKWTVDRDGFVKCLLLPATSNTAIAIKVNNSDVFGYAVANPNIITCTVPVVKGDVVSFAIVTSTGGAATFSMVACYYIPPIAVVSNVATAYAMVPDYANKEPAQLMTVANPNYTADKDGYLTFYLRSSSTSDFGVVVNGEVLYRVAAVTISGPLVQVCKGDIVSINGALSDISCQYIPPKYMPLDTEELATKEELQAVDDKFLFVTPGTTEPAISLSMQDHVNNDYAWFKSQADTFNASIANIQKQIDTINESVMNKTLDHTQDLNIESLIEETGGWTVTGTLGGQINGSGGSYLIAGVGYVMVDDAIVYDNRGLPLSISAPAFSATVDSGAVITGGDMTTLVFTPYKAG